MPKSAPLNAKVGAVKVRDLLLPTFLSENASGKPALGKLTTSLPNTPVKPLVPKFKVKSVAPS